MRKILIPLDGTDYSIKILPVIESFITNNDTTLYLLQVADWASLPPKLAEGPYRPSFFPNRVPEGEYKNFLSYEWEDLQKQIIARLNPLKFRLEALGYQVSTVVRYGEPSDEILKLVDEEDFDLVAMTTHAREGLKRFLLGSVAETVLHHMNLPILLLHPVDRPDTTYEELALFEEN